MKAGNLDTKCQGVDTSEGAKKTTRLRSKFFDSEGKALSYEKIVKAFEGSLANEVSKSTE